MTLEDIATKPVDLLPCISGSGKSTLVNDTLYAAVARTLYRAHDEPAAHESIEPRNGSWMRASVPRAAGLARRDEAAHSGAQ